MSIFKYIWWALLFIPMLFIAQVFRILAPIACTFIECKMYATRVKRFDKQYLELPRDMLIPQLRWFDTFDNATDEYWFGVYPLTEGFTQADYDNSALLRWFFRVCWLWRNSAYGFKYACGISKDSPLAWQYKGNSFINGRTINIGWKAHKGFDKLMFAGRVI